MKESCFSGKSVFMILQVVATYLEVPSASTRARIMPKKKKQTDKAKEPNHSTPKVTFVFFFTVLVDLQGICLFACINDCIPLHIEPAALRFSTYLFCFCPWEVVSPTAPTVSVLELSYIYSKGQPDTYSCSLLSRQTKNYQHCKN